MKRMFKRVVGVAVALCMMVTSTTAFAAKSPGIGEARSFSVSSRAADTNLALGKTATASDVENGTNFTADLAVDGLANTRWASNPDYGATKSAKWLKVNFGETVTFDTVEIKFEQQNIISYRVEVSDDDSNWTPVYESSSKITSTDQSILLSTPAYGKYIRVNVTNYDGNWPSVSIFELAVYNYAGGGEGPEEPTGNYKIYPTPQKVTDSETVVDITSTVNVVKEDGIDAVTKNRIDEVLSDNGLTAQYSDSALDGKTNLYIGVNGSGGAADSHADVPRDVFAPGDNKYDMHVVKVFDNGDIVILGKDTDAAFYGLATLDQMLEQNESGKLKVSTFEDYAFQKYRGCVEGYYGYPWSVEGTLSWFDFAKRYKMNIFLYGPKTDPYHLGKWDEDYPTEVSAEDSKIGIRTQEEMTQFAEKAAECNVDFVWVAHPAMKKPIDFTNESTVDEGVDRLMVKFDHMYQMGVREFGVFVDDIDPNVIDPMATKEMQAYMIDQVQKRLYATYNKEGTAPENRVKNLFFTPVTYATSYGGAASYLSAFKNIHEDIEICFTGNNVFSSIRNSDAATFKNWVGRTPVLWWNYPVNDNKDNVYYTCPINYYYTQDPNPTNLKGVLSNPMNFSESSKVAFFGVADYTWNPGAFDAVENWNNCFEGIFPDDPEMAAALKVVYGSLNNEYEPSGLSRLYAQFNNGDANAAAALKDKMYEMMAAIEKLETLKQSDDPVERLLVEEAQTSINKLYDMAAAIGGAMAAISSDDPLEQIHGYYLAKAANERLNIVRNPRYEIVALEGAGEDIYYNILQAIPSDNKMKGFVTTAMNQIAEFTPPTMDAGVADIQGITIDPSENIEVQQGTSRQFAAYATSSNANVDDVIWSVEGATGAGTAISYNGVLTVDNNELSPAITVKAVSAYDSSKTASVTVTVTDRVYVDPTIPVNLSPSATVLGASGKPGVGGEPENALDDNQGTKWCPGDFTRYNQWMAFDLGAEKVISKWQMVHAGVEDTADISSAYSLQILKDPNATPEQLANKSYLGDNNNWITVAEYTHNESNVTNYTFDEPVTARYLRLFVADGCQPNVRYEATRIFECRVYGVDKATVENTYSLSIDPNITNGTLQTDASNYQAGAKVNIRILPDEGYQLKEGSLKMNGAPIEGKSFIMPAENVTVTAEFELNAQTKYNVTIDTMSNGTVTADKAAAVEGETVNLTVTPDEGYRLVEGSLKVNGAAITGSSFMMPGEDAVVTATFEKIPSVTTVLEAVIEKAVELKENGALSGTMQAVVNEFNAALEAAQTLAADPGDATQEEINAATIRLLNVMAKVDWKQGDTTLLEIAVEVAETIEPNLSLYVEAGKQEFIDALNAARELLSSGNAWDDDIQAAAMKLIDAMNNLRMAANKDILNEMIENAKTYDLSKYTEASANTVRAALAKAEALAADENATQKAVDATAQSLKAALDGLVVKNAVLPNGNANGSTSNMGDGSHPTKTGDAGVSSLAVLALISAAGALVLSKKKRS